MEPSLENVARATGIPLDELDHMFFCVRCMPGARCDSNPTLIREAIAAYRGRRPDLHTVREVPIGGDPDEEYEEDETDPDVMAAYRAARNRSTVLNAVDNDARKQ